MFVVQVDGIPSVDKAAKLLGQVADQMDFVIMTAVNGVAERAQEFLANTYLGTKFTIRRAWMKPNTKFGINLKRARMQNLEATIYSRAPWLMLQEYGGTKGPGKFSAITIPDKKIRQDTDRLIPKKLSPGKVMANMKKYRAFEIKGNIFQRTGPGKNEIQHLFTLSTNAHIKAVLGMRAKGVELVKQWYEAEFRKALAFALSTQKGMVSG